MTPHICDYCNLPTFQGRIWHTHCKQAVTRRDPEQIELGKYIAEFVWDSLSRRNRA